jgi:hypothetical protein
MLPETASTLMSLRNSIREDMNNYTDDLATGANINDFAAYQRMVGRIEGFAIAERHLLNLVDKAKAGEDDE